VIYCIASLDPWSGDHQIFATVGGRVCTMYQIFEDDGSILPLLGFEDEDVDEVLYACVFGRLDPTYEKKGKASTEKGREGPTLAQPIAGDFFLAFAGLKGVITVQHFGGGQNDDANHRMCLQAHGGAINDLKVHPKDEALLFSASKDESIRMWSVRSGACAAVFAGDQGHISEVLYIDINDSCTKLASGGMDSAIRIWSLEKQVSARIEAAHASNTNFSPVILQLPDFISNLSNIWQPNYIDCIRWVGDMLAAKSVHNQVVLLEIVQGKKKQTLQVRHEFNVSYCNIWYLRFAISPNKQWVGE